MRRKRVAWLLALGLLAGTTTLFRFGSSKRAFSALPAPPREIPVGTALPSFVLTNDRGQAVPLASLRGSPTVLLFFRATSCPSCRAQLAAFAGAAATFRAAGVEVVAASPDSPATLATAREQLHLP
ncbi:MAG TPA: redoxin domain-containing protein, partial [Polyangia bacterium]|nr:redoxin domain-containing protein [Polyangia bacterium]